MLGTESVELGLGRDVAEDIDKLLFASVIELTSETTKIFLNLTTLSI